MLLCVCLFCVSCREDSSSIEPTSSVMVKYKTSVSITEYYLYKYIGKSTVPSRVRVVNVHSISQPDSNGNLAYSFLIKQLEPETNYIIQFNPNSLGSKLIRASSNQTQEYSF